VILFRRLGRQIWEDPRYGLLVSLAVPGLIWQNFSAFFQEGRLELAIALFLPLVLFAGCYIARLTVVDLGARWIFGVLFVLAGAQSLAGLNPFYFAPKLNGHGYELRHIQGGEHLTSFRVSHRQVSWRNLADVIQRLQQEQGANLLITDSPNTASALSFYLPHNPSVYVEDQPGVITQFDFWPRYDESASPNDSALYLTGINQKPPEDLMKNFASVTPIDDPPTPGFDRSWSLWSCQRFIGSGQSTGADQSVPMHESDALPK
jgi:hypothetical protein